MANKRFIFILMTILCEWQVKTVVSLKHDFLKVCFGGGRGTSLQFIKLDKYSDVQQHVFWNGVIGIDQGLLFSVSPFFIFSICEENSNCHIPICSRVLNLGS